MVSCSLLGIGLAMGCGDSDSAGGPDASNIDAGASLRLDAVIDNVALCPEGWTSGPTAVDEDGANRITVSASCADGAEEVILLYAPRPTSTGQTAPCTQSTFRSSAGATVICRLNNEVRLDPEGEITVTGAMGTVIDGGCGCMGDDGGTMRTGGANFLLSLD